jgi:zinc finger protein
LRCVLPNRCPLCDKEIVTVYQTEDIPYFSKVLLVSGNCDCGYRYADTMILSELDPVGYTCHIEGVEDLSIRVVRSSRGMVEVPELGVRIEPGPACEGFITNVEGVLDRIDGVLEGVLAWSDGEEREKAEELRALIAEIRTGTMPLTLIIEDPSGNSAIISEKAVKTRIRDCEGENAPAVGQ